MSKPIAIRVNNKREFDVLIRHMESKGWDSWQKQGAENTLKVWNVPNVVEYKNEYGAREHSYSGDFTILDFTQFAEISGIELPKEIRINLGGGYSVLFADGYIWLCINNIPQIRVEANDLEAIYTAYKQIEK